MSEYLTRLQEVEDQTGTLMEAILAAVEKVPEGSYHANMLLGQGKLLKSFRQRLAQMKGEVEAGDGGTSDPRILAAETRRPQIHLPGR